MKMITMTKVQMKLKFGFDEDVVDILDEIEIDEISLYHLVEALDVSMEYLKSKCYSRLAIIMENDEL